MAGGTLLRAVPARSGVIEYPIGQSKQVLRFTDPVLRHFEQHRQVRFWQREAGGQLFARLQPGLLIVEEATGPRPTDRRTRTSYVADRVVEQREINERHASGLHYIGDWHTHPERVPVPSPRDVASMVDCFTKSTHALHAFVLVIIGKLEFPTSIHVSLHDGHDQHTLTVAAGALWRREDLPAAVGSHLSHAVTPQQ